MRILITNHALVNRAGSELYVKDVAEGLLRRGHTPIAYSTKLGAVAAELRAATVPVVDHLASISITPDLIHGQHHIETMSALLHFAGVPAVYFCHGWLAWEEAPPRFPRILRYIAVDDTCRDRLICEQNIPERQVCVVRNFVDLAKFKLREPLPVKPKRALVFSNYAGESSHVNAVREACDRAGLSLDVIGIESNNATDKPESLLGEYDLVFAKARCAFEAMAVGTAVILCDQTGLGPMVTAGELDRLKRLNFGVRALREPLKAETITQELARYDAADAREVTRRVRASSGLEAALDQIVNLYEEVIEEYQDSPAKGANGSNGHNSNADTAALEARCAAEYLRDVALHITRQREAIYQSTSYRLGSFLVRAPLLRGWAKRVAKPRSE